MISLFVLIYLAVGLMLGVIVVGVEVATAQSKRDYFFYYWPMIFKVAAFWLPAIAMLVYRRKAA